MRTLVLMMILAAVLAACDTTVPTPPPITVVITAVDNSEALDDAVAQALTATAQVHINATETALAFGGISPTPSLTPTLTPTIPVRTPRPGTPTWTPTPTITPTPTFAPYVTSTPVVVDPETPGAVRVVHAWRGTPLNPAASYDVYLNGQVTARGLSTGQQTAFQQVPPGPVEVALRFTGVEQTFSVLPPPDLSTVLQVAPGGNTTVVIALDPAAPELIVVPEDAAPLPQGISRLTLVQANPVLLPVNLLMPELERALAYDLDPGDLVGPLDMPSGAALLVDLYDANLPDQFLGSLEPFTLYSRVSYLLVLVPSGRSTETDVFIFPSSTRLLPNEFYARFINAALNIDSFDVQLGNYVQFNPLPLGISPPVPVSNLGTDIRALSQGGEVIARLALAEDANGLDPLADKLVLFYETQDQNSLKVNITAFSQTAPPSAINASVRLIHAIPGLIPLNLQVRPVRTNPVLPTPEGQTATATPTPPPDEAAWITIAEAPFATASDYIQRSPDLFDVRVILSGTRNVIAQVNNVQLRAGGVYDFVAHPGTEAGSAQLEVLEPRAQTAPDQGNPAAVSEAVRATLTALAPEVVASATPVFTPTLTRTPVPTNTPRPTNTPDFPPPSISVDPAPPNAAVGSVVVSGRDFRPGRPFAIRFNNADPIQTGVVAEDGTLLTVVPLGGLPAGPHVVRLCVDCTSAQAEEAFTVVIVAGPNRTPTVTPQP